MRRVLDEDTCGNREWCAMPPLEDVPPTLKRWKCPVCMVVNSRYRDDCHECGREKSDLDT